MSDTQTENIAMLAEILEEYKSHSTNSGFSREKQALTAAIEALKSRGEWISVDDRLPQRDMECLIYPPADFGVDQHVAFFNYYALSFQSEDYCQWEGSTYQSVQVTHWMPLPTPPTEVSK